MGLWVVCWCWLEIEKWEQDLYVYVFTWMAKMVNFKPPLLTTVYV